MINLEGRPAVVVGGGEVALRKVQDLLAAGAAVQVIAPELHTGIEEQAGHEGRLTITKREYREGDLEGALLVFSATNSADVNRHVYAEAQNRNILINAVDDPPNCTFYIPSFVRRGSMLLTLSTSGTSPAMAARLRRELEQHIPENIEQVHKTLDEARSLLKQHSAFAHLDTRERGRILKQVVNDDRLLEKACSAGNADMLVAVLRELVAT